MQLGALAADSSPESSLCNNYFTLLVQIYCKEIVEELRVHFAL